MSKANYSLHPGKTFVYACASLLVLVSCSKIHNNPPPEQKPPVTDSPSVYAGIPQSDIYEVTVIRTGGVREKQIVFQNACPVYQKGYMNMTTNDMYPLGIFKDRTINWTTFSFSGAITVEVKLLNQNRLSMSSQVTILPSRYGITPAVNGNTISFTMSKPGQCSVEIDLC
jgi:hypothetical protein